MSYQELSVPQHPVASVCIPSYNHARFLPAAIESVLTQTYKDFEIVIVDDGSTDDSFEIAQGYAARYPSKVRVFTHSGHRNLGISETVNLGFRLSRGQYFSGLPSDDLLYPEKLEKQVAFLNRHPGYGWVYGCADYIDETGQPRTDLGLFGEDITSAADPLHSLILRNVIPGMSVLARRSVFEKVGDHDPALIYSDWEFWVRMLAQSPVAFVPNSLVKYRVHSYNTSWGPGSQTTLTRSLQVMLSLCRKAAGLVPALALPQTIGLLHLQVAFYSYCLRETATAQRNLREAFEKHPGLAHDRALFTRWLRSRVDPLVFYFPFTCPERDFNSWLLVHLPPHAKKRLAGYVKAAEFATKSFETLKEDRRSSRRMVLSCVIRDPKWLANRALRSALVENVVGARMVQQLRRLKCLFPNYS